MAYSTGIKKFNWVYKPTAYENAQAWKEKRSAMAADFQYQSSLTANSFATATINQSIGMGQLTATAAISRMQSESKAKSATARSINMSI